MYQSQTAKLYQSGIELSEAVAKGADPEIFEQLETSFKGGSIPLHLLRGFEYNPPYSCDYHIGGAMSAKLRNLIKEQS